MSWATLVADPDWKYSRFSQAKHGAARAYYEGSTVDYMMDIPVIRWARRNSILLLWVTNPKIFDAVDVARAWGFELVTAWPWIKVVPSKAELAKGIGHWVHQSSEQLWCLRRGKAKAPFYDPLSDKPDGLLCGPREDMVFYSRRGPHSRKPLSLIEWIESYFPGPYLELYARDTRRGWTTLGGDVGTWLVPRQIDASGVLPFEEAKAMGLVPQKKRKNKKRRKLVRV